MKRAKKMLALLLTVTLCLSLTACGGNGGAAEKKNDSAQKTQKEAEGAQESEPAEEKGEQAKADDSADGEKKKIIFFTAFIGDFGLSDMGYRAVQEVAEEYNMDWTLVEYGSYDAALAVNCFWDALETTDYDYFFGPAWYIEDIIDDAAAEYVQELARQSMRLGADAVEVCDRDFAQNERLVKDVKACGDIPVILGGGTSVENCKDRLRYADGALVGTAFEGGKWGGPIIGSIVADYVRNVRELEDECSREKREQTE